LSLSLCLRLLFGSFSLFDVAVLEKITHRPWPANVENEEHSCGDHLNRRGNQKTDLRRDEEEKDREIDKGREIVRNVPR
jgi:hypothetical protein